MPIPRFINIKTICAEEEQSQYISFTKHDDPLSLFYYKIPWKRKSSHNRKGSRFYAKLKTLFCEDKEDFYGKYITENG